MASYSWTGDIIGVMIVYGIISFLSEKVFQEDTKKYGLLIAIHLFPFRYINSIKVY